MASVSIQSLEKSFGAVSILKDIDLEFGDGEFVVIVGPSGCGKSTLLRIISGLERVSGGRISIGGKDMTEVDAAERGIAMVFQSYALYPHMTVAENMGFGLKMTGTPKTEVEAAVGKAARMLRLEPLLSRRPRQLSGGQRQRVAIGRAIVREPDVFLFDEPLSNLDAELRVEMRNELAQLHQDLRSTMVYVTHDQVEAMTLADRIVVMHGGIVEQVGTPMELYGNPRNKFVASFIGSPKMNFLRVEMRGGTAFLECAAGEPVLSAPPRAAEETGATLGIRPEHLTIHGNAKTKPGGKQSTLGGKVALVENLGGTSFIHAITDSGERVVIECRDGPPAIGTVINVSFDPAKAYLFDGSGERLI